MDVMVDAAALWLPLAAPLVGAALLAVPGAARVGRRWWDPVTLAALGLALLGLACAVVTWPVIGSATRFEVGLGPLDPSTTAAGIAWSLAPVALGVLFAALAFRARSRLLIGLALVQLAVAGVGATWELLEPASGAETHHALVVDPLALTLLGVSILVGGLITVYALGYEPVHLGHKRLATARTAAFLAWLLAFVSAMDLLVLADDLRLLVVGWEVTTLCSFMLIGFDGDTIAITAARRALAYNLLGGIALGAAVLLAGPGGHVSDLTAGQASIGWAMPLILAGCIGAAATKSALVPFHPWLLGAMVAAAPVSGLLHASAMVKAGSYLLLRLSPPIAADGLLGPALTVLGGYSFAVTALEALRQRDLKRILAFSTISTLGLIAAAAGLGSAAALSAGVLLLVFHAVAKALAFLSVGAIEQVTETRDLEALVGSMRTVPRLASPLIVAAISLALPPFGLVVAKWAILEVGAREVPLMVLLAVGGAAYLALWTAVIARLIVRRPAELEPARANGSLPARERLPIAILGVAAVAGLLLAAPLARGLADPAAEVAFGIDPGLASGWSIALNGGSFLIPTIALLGLTAVLVAFVVGRRVQTVAPAPYLSGATLAHGPTGAFHGVVGRPVMARSGGFYWGSQVATAEPGPSEGAVPAPDGSVGGLGPSLVAIGWVLLGLVGLAAAIAAVAVGPGR